MSSILAIVTAALLLVMTSQAVASSQPQSDESSAPLDASNIQDLVTLDDTRLLKRSLHEALQQHFQLLQEAEEDILQRIEALKVKRQAISQRKRSHYMCLVNIVACYK